MSFERLQNLQPHEVHSTTSSLCAGAICTARHAGCSATFARAAIAPRGAAAQLEVVRHCNAFSANEASHNTGTQTMTSTTYLAICAALFCLLASGGCAATSSVLSGSRIETRPLFTPPQLAPHATRRSDGALVITAHFQTIRKATVGDLFSSGRSLSSEEKLIVVPASQLRPAQNIIAGIFKPYDREMLRTMLNTPIDARSPNTKNAKLDVLNGWPTNGSQFVCPSHECVIYRDNFVWYVPPSGPQRCPKFREKMGALSPLQ